MLQTVLQRLFFIYLTLCTWKHFIVLGTETEFGDDY